MKAIFDDVALHLLSIYFVVWDRPHGCPQKADARNPYK